MIGLDPFVVLLITFLYERKKKQETHADILSYCVKVNLKLEEKMFSSNNGKRYDTSFKIHCGVRATERRKKINLIVQKLTFDTNLDTFITYTVPIAVLIQRHICEGSNSRKSEHRRVATKAREMKYFTLSPGFPHRLKSSALPSFRGSAQLQHALP